MAKSKKKLIKILEKKQNLIFNLRKKKRFFHVTGRIFFQKHIGQTSKTALWFCSFWGFSPSMDTNKIFFFSTENYMFFFFLWQKSALISWRYKRYLRWLKKLMLKDKLRYKTFCLKHFFPVRGQRTHSNAKTSKRLKLRFIKRKSNRNLTYVKIKTFVPH